MLQRYDTACLTQDQPRGRDSSVNIVTGTAAAVPWKRIWIRVTEDKKFLFSPQLAEFFLFPRVEVVAYSSPTSST